jgi:acyl transferase domain-containing protein/NAD(P)-dependent dehydrogenase (short-subunit alcohol dehydrogenase family)
LKELKTKMTSAAYSPESTPGVTFTFPGQGSYSYGLLRELYTSYPVAVPYFEQAHDISRQMLGGDFLSLVAAESASEHDERLSTCPDLDQVGIYLTEVLIANILIEAGITPALLAGHSFGELAALAVGGAYSIDDGLRIVCLRVLALRSARPGVMAAISCDEQRAKQFLEELGNNSIEISVINHQRQTVLSGHAGELESLGALVNRFGVSLTVLASRYPFHSSLLQAAVAPFRTALQSYRFRQSAIPVFLSMEGVLYSPGSDLAEILSSQFVRTLCFRDVVKTLYKSGYRTFVECGAGDIVTRLIGQNLTGVKDSVFAASVGRADGSLREGIAMLRDRGLAARPVSDAPKAAIPGQGQTDDRAHLLNTLSTVVGDMSSLVQSTSRLIQQLSKSATAAGAASDLVKPFEPAVPASTPARDLNPEELAAPKDPVAPKPSSARYKPAPVSPNLSLAASDSNGGVPTGERRERGQEEQSSIAPEKCSDVPVAIVSMGCVLPGAIDPEGYWSNILNGVSGISNLTEIDPSAASDFLASPHEGAGLTIVSDKTYTLMHGTVIAMPYEHGLLSPAYTGEQFEGLTRGQKLLALAVAQSLSRLKTGPKLDASARVQCILGGTADGSKEYDEALFLDSIHRLMDTLDEPDNLRNACARFFEEITGYRRGDSDNLTQHSTYTSVIERLLGSGIPTYIVDTACSSSLYSTYLGVKALQDGVSDIVLAGGVFAPGPANNTLFAQFRGLAERDSRPFDASADGVIFGDGAGILVLKRLTDALEQRDRIIGVIRGIGLSSDGKSPSINVPQAKGQALAIEAAYERSGVDISTIQYVEAHATATLVGDAVEFNALKRAMKRDPASPPIELGSVKALIGHTGWAAGVASVIKICKAFEARLIPKQFHYASPSPEIDLAHSQFIITETPHDWVENTPPYPRRAAINGFGFGGTNAHLIIEEFNESYHRALINHLSVQTRGLDSLAVIGFGSLFPGADQAFAGEPTAETRFDRKSLRLPAKKMLLPDVTDHMDASQYLAAMAAEKAFSTMPGGWTRFRSTTGVVLGLESKTERGRRANERIFADRLQRQVSQGRRNGKSGGVSDMTDADLDRILQKLIEAMRSRNLPSGPYTLPGLMPNVAASRIASMFDLNGPNIVIDRGRDSLVQSLYVAGQLLGHDACKIVLAGGINANDPAPSSRGQEDEAEAAFILALTAPETARGEGWPVMTTVNLLGRNDQPPGQQIIGAAPNRNYRAAQAAPEILRAIGQSRHQALPWSVRQNGAVHGKALILGPSPTPSPSTTVSTPSRLPAPVEHGAYAYVKDTPINRYGPRLVLTPARGDAKSLRGRRILFLTDQPDRWLSIEKSGVLAGIDYHLVCPTGEHLINSIAVDLSSEERIHDSLDCLPTLGFDALIAFKSLEGRSGDSLLLNDYSSELVWLDLLFATCRHVHDRLRTEGAPVIAVFQGAYIDGRLDPYTGLAAGFMKSLSRELEGPICRVMNTDETDFATALRQVEIELGQDGPVEVAYKAGTRTAFALIPIQKLASDAGPYLNSNSVVLATGGARGVTAVLVEELLQRFGCRVIALGRTDPSSIPEEIRKMSEDDFAKFEPEFYKNELTRNRGKKITDLKRQYKAYQAANEVHHVSERLRAISEKFEYRSIDITSESATDAIVKEAYHKYGRVDMVLHGAGIQMSSALTKKTLFDFRRIVDTKLDGLAHLYRACKKHSNGHRTHFHILTSAFSYLGNDGQPDYGAANEAMARIAACMNSQGNGSYWSSMGWLGWAGVGMTRGSEYAALAASRRLRGVTPEEGRQIFADVMAGPPTSPINVLLADGEMAFYRPEISSESFAAAEGPETIETAGMREGVVEWPLSPDAMPFLYDHLVRGVPTVPGSFITAIAADAAHKLIPGLKISQFERTRFLRMVRAYEGRPTHLRAATRIVERNGDEVLVEVQILIDFVHKSGLVLGKDVLHTHTYIRMAPQVPEPPREYREANHVSGPSLPDPYTLDQSPVRLSGPFRAMKTVVVGPTNRRAEYKPNGAGHYGSAFDHLMPNVILVDAFWRFGTVQANSKGGLSVYVPERCDTMKVFFDYTDFDAPILRAAATFHGANPRAEGDVLHVGPIDAFDSTGRLILCVEGGVCRKFGDVEAR